MTETAVRSGDYLDRMRGIAVAALLAAAAAATLGSFLHWVEITPPPVVTETNFGGTTIPAPDVTKPFSGVEATDGWWVIGLSAILVAAAVLLLVRKRSSYGWLAFLTAVVMGSIVFADYRGIGDISSSISHRMDIVGKADPAIGLTMVAAAVVVAVVGSLMAIAASPRRDV